MILNVTGLVLRVTDIGESDRMLTLYTKERGTLSVYSRGSRNLKSRSMSATMQFCYSDFVLFGKGDKLWVREASLIENFHNIRIGIDALAVASYVLEVIDDVGTAEPDDELMRLSLNTLYALTTEKYGVEIIKAAFEIRVAAILGFAPDLFSCHGCGTERGEFYFDVMAGVAECSDCHKRSENRHSPLSEAHEAHILCLLTEGARAALYYCLYSPVDRLFSFTLSGEDMRLFVRACEAHLINHLERSFRSLDFYNEVKR